MGQVWSNTTPEAKATTVNEFIRDTNDPAKQKQFDELVNTDDLKGFAFPFENLVMEGGGTKGIAYCGVLKVFEELGMMKQITRIAGTSAGALSAALVAVGYSADEIMEILQMNLEPIFLDSSYVSAVPNFFRYYGWHKADKYSELMKSLLEKKTGNPDITFGEVYQKYGKELCIVVTNVTTMMTGFCHPKTTPNFPIWEAARMSMSIPGLMVPYQYTRRGVSYYCVDGGVVCNYPLRAFDGWWLSMKPENSFLMKMTEVDKKQTIRDWQFSGVNDKTVGLLLFSGNENEFKRDVLLDRSGFAEIERPAGTALSKERGEELDKNLKKVEDGVKVFRAATKFVRKIKSLKESDHDISDRMTREEVEQAFLDPRFDKKDTKLVFGNANITVDDAIKSVTGRKNADEITFDELLHFFMKRGVNLQAHLEGSTSEKSIGSFTDYLSAILSTVDLNEKMEQLGAGDIDRTIGIYTDYLSTTDFNMEDEDKKFLMKQGMLSAVKFLRRHMNNS